MKKLLTIAFIAFAFASYSQTWSCNVNNTTYNFGDTLRVVIRNVYDSTIKTTEGHLVLDNFGNSKINNINYDSTSFYYLKGSSISTNRYSIYSLIIKQKETGDIYYYFYNTSKTNSCSIHIVHGFPTGIDDFNVNDVELKSVIYYNLNGIEINNPDNYEGVLIKKTFYSNGKITTTKVLQ